MKTVKIRRAQHSDALAIIESHIRSIREVCYKDYSPEQIEAWAGRNHKSSLWCQSMDRDLVWVVEVDGKVKGFGHLAVMSQELGEIMGFYLAPDAIGLGAGDKLMLAILQESREQKLKELQLHSTITAKGFYERYGFRQSAGDSSVEIRGVAIPCHPMSYILNS